jgi:pimeloyl-ACP methyl ester carboxylesterase
VTCGEPQEPFIIETIRRTDGRARKMNREEFASGAGGDQRAIAATSPVPIAVVNGSNEPFVNLDFVSKVKFGSLWEGRCHIIENSGHAPFWDAPGRFNEIFARFLQDMEKTWRRN